MLVLLIVICFGYFMPMSHCVNKKAPPIAYPHPSPYQVFTSFVHCFTRNTLSTLFCFDQIIANIMHLQNITNFFFQLIARRF